MVEYGSHRALLVALGTLVGCSQLFLFTGGVWIVIYGEKAGVGGGVTVMEAVSGG